MLPGPTTVSPAVLREMAKPIIGHRSKENSLLIADTKEKAKKVFQTKNDMLIITASSTGGVESSITNVVKKGDNFSMKLDYTVRPRDKLYKVINSE